MSRIKKLESHYQKQLKDHKIKDISRFIHSIVDADVTKGKYARFLIESFLNNKFLEEDLIGGLNSTVGQAISLFDKHKGKLSVEERSVYALNPETGEELYQSPGDLWNSVKQFQGELSGKELKKEEQEKIYRETAFVYKDEETGFQIISPLTEESAKWWGRGTRWCTSADNDNMFDYYNNIASLLILLLPTNVNTAGNSKKLQLWNNKRKRLLQFMDESDNDVSLEYIEQHWSILEPICLWLNNLKYIPEKYLTQELCELAVKQDGLTLNDIPEYLKTPEIYELAVQQNGLSITYIPKELRTKELCELAVKQDGYALNYVPEKYLTQELCILSISHKKSHLISIPDKYKTKEIYELAVKQNGRALGDVPEEYKTKEMCKLAVKQNGLALLYIPKQMRTQELCELAVKQDGNAIRYTPKDLRTQELCELALKNGCDVRYMNNINKKDSIYKFYEEKRKEQLLKINQRDDLYNEIKEYYNKKSTYNYCL
jgi:hypothetical protein